MRNSWVRIVLPLLLISSASSGHAQVTSPGFDPSPLELKPVAKPAPHIITSMDLLTIRDITGIQISPDGKSVAYVVSQVVYISNGYRTALFVVGTNPGNIPTNLGSGGPPQWNIAGEYKRIDPQWSPDSRYITYLKGKKDRRQVWMWSRSGGKPEQLTHNNADVESYEWQPDGKRIIFSTVEPISAEEIKSVSEQGILYDSDASADFYGSIRAWQNRPIAYAALEAKPRKRQTWIYDFSTRIERRVTPEEESEYRKLHQPPDIWTSSQKSSITMTRSSPNGKLIAYASMLNDSNKSSTYELSISIFFFKQKTAYEIVTPSTEYIGDLWWDRAGNEVYFTRLTDDKGRALFAVPAVGGPVREIIKGNKDMLSAFSLDESRSRVACLRESPILPPEVAVIDLKDGVVRTLVNVNTEFENLKLSPARKLEWTNKYGDHAFGYLIKPLSFEPEKRYPLIVNTYYCRNFLRGGVGDEYPLQVFAANNFAVLCLDLLHGKVLSSKAGDFEAAMLRWKSAMASLEQATKSVVDEMGIIDPQRKGVTGLSYGSEVVHFTISHSDLFQAAVASGGNAQDPIFYYLANAWWHRQFAQWGLNGFPDGKAADRWRQLSPALNANRVWAPILIHSADSEYIQGLQFYTSMKELHKPVELIIYADEGHIMNQPKHRYEIYKRNVDWFNFWLHDKEDHDPAKSEQYTRWREMRKVLNEDRSTTGSRKSDTTSTP